MTPLLLHIVDKQVAREYRLERFPALLGRLPESQVVIADTQVSRRHARLVKDPSGFYIEDLNSTNFVYVNGKKAGRGALKHGDFVNVGGVADFLFLTRPDPQLVELALERVPVIPGADEPRPADALEVTSLAVGTLLAAAPSPAPPPTSKIILKSGVLSVAAPVPEPAPEPAPARIAPDLEDLARLHDVSYELLGKPDAIPDGLRALVDHAIHVAGGQRGFLLARSERVGARGEWQVRCARSADGADLDEDERETWSAPVVERAVAVDETCTSLQMLADSPGWGARSLPRSMREVICTPLRVSDWVLGVLVADGCRVEGGFSQRGLTFFELFAYRAAEALERQRLSSGVAEQHRHFLTAAEELKEAQKRLRDVESRIEALEDSASTSPGAVAPAPPADAARPAGAPEETAELPPVRDPWDVGVPLAGESSRKAALPDFGKGKAGSDDYELILDSTGGGAASQSALSTLKYTVPPPSAMIRSIASPASPGGPVELLGKSQDSLELLAKAREVARLFEVVLISGDLGTGKKTLARAIHSMSNRARAPFVHFRCAEHRAADTEGALFGWSEPQARGPGLTHSGQVDEAAGGVLFLEDVERLPMSAQERLEHLLANKRFRRVGSEDEVKAELKLIVSTTRDLRDEADQGNFHRDLYYYRIGIVHLHIRPLAERPEDVEALAVAWLAEQSKRFGKNVRGLSPAARALFEHYPWPGNLLELRNSIEAAVMACSRKELEPADLPPALQDFHRRQGDGSGRRR
jgi:transcriptional regulator with GAF, ATPase, and Fis domain